MDTIKKRILRVRHGTTAYNEGDRLQSRSDFCSSPSHLDAGE